MYTIRANENGVCAPKDFFADGIHAGLKPDGAKDLAFIFSPRLCDISAVFTTNTMQAAPIRHFKQKGSFQTNCVLINSKNANALTADAGVNDIEEILSALEQKFPQVRNPVMSSTGVIGVRLPKETIKNAIERFDLRKRDSVAAATAIMTTDTFYKQCAFDVILSDGSQFSIGAIAKGAGMINPAMATMLCFITTDADIPKTHMQELLNELSETTFNAVSVDGDTSTNDTVMLLTNRASKAYDKAAFEEALHTLMLTLAKMLVKDGEGATKLVSFSISGAADDFQAQKAAKALSNSLLVKTALYGEDPNWGRIAATIGACGIEAYEERLRICFDDVCVYDRGKNLFDASTEKKAAAVMQKSEFTISCDLGVASGRFVAYGCDLGYEYVKINADYRT